LRCMSAWRITPGRRCPINRWRGSELEPRSQISRDPKGRAPRILSRSLAMPTAMFGLKHTLLRSLRTLPGVRELLDFSRRNVAVVSEAQIDQFHADGYMI